MDLSSKSTILAQLKAEITSLSPQMRTAAKYIIDRPTDFGLDPIRDTAQKAHVSTYTLVNISKYLGFAGFEALRHPFRQDLLKNRPSGETPTWSDDFRALGDLGQVYADTAENAQSVVAQSLASQNLAEFEAVTELLISAKKVYLTAMRSSYAMAYYFHYVGRMALPSLDLIPRHINSAIDDLSDAGAGDVLIAITVTPYSSETVKACEFARKKGMKLVVISDSEIVLPHLNPEHTLVASVQSTHNFGSFSGMMAVLEMLVSFLMHRGGKDAKDRINSYEKVRIENNAYWVAQKKH